MADDERRAGARQSVAIHRIADRHASLHGRDFADTVKTTPTTTDVRAALALLGLAVESSGAYTIAIDWPHDG